MDNREKKVECKFDKIYDEHATQADVYESVKDLAESVVRGYNATVFAYGQTVSYIVEKPTTIH